MGHLLSERDHLKHQLCELKGGGSSKFDGITPLQRIALELKRRLGVIKTIYTLVQVSCLFD